MIFGVKKGSLSAYADKAFMAKVSANAVRVLTYPFELVLSMFSSSLGAVVIVFFLCAVVFTSADSSGVLLKTFEVSYNSVAPLLNKLLDLFLLAVNFLRRVVLPMWNAFNYFIGQLISAVLGPVIWTNATDSAACLEGLGKMFASLAKSFGTLFENAGKCVQIPAASHQFDCAANPAFLSLDLMTPGVFAKLASEAFVRILVNICAVAAIPSQISLYPLMDYNFYKMLHCFCNIPFSLLRIAVNAVHRCDYVQNMQPKATMGEIAVACAPDIAPFFSVITTGLRALGALLDNWANVGIEILVAEVSGRTKCADVPFQDMQGLISDASKVFDEVNRRRIVGVSPGTVAVTDGVDVLHRSSNGQDIWALSAWPFPVDVRFGIAAVHSSISADFDEAGYGRTGLLGCRCDDAPFRITCATIPFVKNPEDDDDNYRHRTEHSMIFVDDVGQMTCARTVVSVTALRFSRRRVAVGYTSGDGDARDFFNAYGENGERGVALTADAAIYVQPSCGIVDGTCSAFAACYPFCMGLHVGQYGSQNITLYNAKVWDDFVSLRQTDCAIERDIGQTCTEASSGFTETVQGQRSAPRCSVTREASCVPNDFASSFVEQMLGDVEFSYPVPSKSRFPEIRRSAQPFVRAGDVVLQEDVQTSSIIVSRLYDNGRGGVSLSNEELTLVSNEHKFALVRCDENDKQCYVNAAQQGMVVTPRSYSLGNEQWPSAASEWGVHWAVNPANEVYQLVFDFCSKGTADFGFLIQSSYGKARVWTLQTMRASNSGSKNTGVSYMRIPNWFDTENLQCEDVVGLKIVDVEFLNSQNILVTVLEGRPKDWDSDIGDVCDVCVKRYRYYFLHPNRHTCADKFEGDGAHFSCWSDSMWPADTDAVTLGKLCPALRRSPPMGSALAEVLVLQVLVAEQIAVSGLYITLAVGGGDLDALQRSRVSGQPRLHSMLDSGGSRLLEVERIIHSYQLVAHKFVMLLVKTFELFQGLPGYKGLEPVVVGTAKVLQHTPAAVNLKRISSQLSMIQESMKPLDLESIVASQQQAAGPLPSGVARISTVFLALVDVFPTAARIIRRVVLRLLRSGPASEVIGGVFTAAFFESQRDVTEGVLASVRIQCHGLAGILRGTRASDNAFSGFVRQVCLSAPDVVESAFTVANVLIVEYPIVACVCRRSAGERVVSHLDSIGQTCLNRVVPISQHEWVLGMLFSVDNQVDLCFATMDGANKRFETAFDKPLSRLQKAANYAAEALNFLVSLFSVDKEACAAYAVSPYVTTIVPEPVDYFMTCVNINDCRLKCYDEMAAFEGALDDLRREHSVPVFKNTISVAVQSPIFSPSASDLSADTPRFQVLGVLELPELACASLCTNAVPRCVAVSGKNGARLDIAYYCIPDALNEYINEAALDVAGIVIEAPAGSIYDTFVATAYHTQKGMHEWLIVTAADEFGYMLFLCIAGLAPRQIMQTKMSEPGRVSLAEYSVGYLQSVSSVQVVPAIAESDPIVVYISGRKREWDANLKSTLKDVHLKLMIVHNLANDGFEFKWSEESSKFDAMLCVDRQFQSACEVRMYLNAETSKGRWKDMEFDLPDTLRSPDILLYSYSGKTAPTRLLLSPMARKINDSQDKFEVVSVNTAGSYKSWLRIVRIDIGSQSVSVTAQSSQTTLSNVPFEIDCRVDRCLGCMDEKRSDKYIDVQAKCYAAQECGVARCVGTLVNMRKPLCNIGQLFAQQLRMATSALGVVWQAVAQHVVVIVELSEGRRRDVELRWADEAVATAICTAKDTVVQVFLYLLLLL